MITTELPASIDLPPAAKSLLGPLAKGTLDAAWNKGELAYEPGDTLQIGAAKAARQNIRPGTNEYAAFLTAFSRRMRLKHAVTQQ